MMVNGASMMPAEAAHGQRTDQPLRPPARARAAPLATTLKDLLECTGGRYGLQTMCEAGGHREPTLKPSVQNSEQFSRESRQPGEGDP
jgi:hypothetical protein